MRGSNKNNHRKVSTVATTICYCEGERELGSLELFCTGCSKWFHGRCLKDLKEFYGLSFMVCYVFSCKDCSPTKQETWVAKQANFNHMCVTVLANLTADQLKREGKLVTNSSTNEKVFFSLQKDIIPYFDANWENLTSMPRRVKNTWHQTLQRTLVKETELFQVHFDDENSFALIENIADIGPVNENVKQIGKKTSAVEKSNLTSTLITAQMHEKIEPDIPNDGPKTRGASKRRTVDNGQGTAKKAKLAADFSTAKIAGIESTVDFPFNKEGIYYFLVEKDPNVPEKVLTEEEEALGAGRAIPAHTYRLVIPSTVTLSPHDRAFQLRLSDDQLTVTGYEGYCSARATHSVCRGKWYYEVNFLKQPEDSAVRLGWSQQPAVLQACVGYQKFSYGWRSKRGTKFHNSIGKSYFKDGFKEGDVLGCLIDLPHDIKRPQVPSQFYLPPSRKDAFPINFKHNFFFEAHEDGTEALKKLIVHPGSRIEFYKNGKCCGVAFTDIYAGSYFPTISIFKSATVRCNFGPRLQHLPRGARAFCDRAVDMNTDQTLSDILHLVHNEQQSI